MSSECRIFVTAVRYGEYIHITLMKVNPSVGLSVKVLLCRLLGINIVPWLVQWVTSG